jgi:hypothetical protein
MRTDFELYQMAATERDKLREHLSILIDSANGVIDWCDKSGSGDSLWCIDRLRAVLLTVSNRQLPERYKQAGTNETTR